MGRGHLEVSGKMGPAPWEHPQQVGGTAAQDRGACPSPPAHARGGLGHQTKAWVKLKIDAATFSCSSYTALENLKAWEESASSRLDRVPSAASPRGQRPVPRNRWLTLTFLHMGYSIPGWMQLSAEHLGSMRRALSSASSTMKNKNPIILISQSWQRPGKGPHAFEVPPEAHQAS